MEESFSKVLQYTVFLGRWVIHVPILCRLPKTATIRSSWLDVLNEAGKMWVSPFHLFHHLGSLSAGPFRYEGNKSAVFFDALFGNPGPPPIQLPICEANGFDRQAACSPDLGIPKPEMDFLAMPAVDSTM